MKKNMTITIDERIYDGLYRAVGRGHISQFIENLVRPHVLENDIDAAYQAMAQDEAREGEVLDWTENLIDDGLSRAR
jgi:hypothetical protein